MTNEEWRVQREQDVGRAFKKAVELVQQSVQLSEVQVAPLIVHLTDRLLDEHFNLYGSTLVRTAAGAQMLQDEQ